MDLRRCEHCNRVAPRKRELLAIVQRARAEAVQQPLRAVEGLDAGLAIVAGAIEHSLACSQTNAEQLRPFSLAEASRWRPPRSTGRRR